MSSLALTLLYLLAAVLGVVACRSLRLPPMMGYLAAGILIGPHALALTQNSEGVRHLGEFGVVFLMFTIGLEFNLPKLRAMRRHVFGLGLLQVLLSMLAFTACLLLLARLGGVWDMGWQTALALGGTLAMSSTAIVVKLMAERGELESEHGRRVLGILLFQDLAVVPLLVLIPALGSSPDKLLLALGLALLKAMVLVSVLLVGGQGVMRWWLTLVARRKSDELFMLNLLLVTLGLAWLTELAGLSLALGAFIAGVLVSETEYRHQVGTDIRPFHDVLLGLFFITVGMMLDWHVMVERWALVLLLLAAPLLIKTAIIVALARGLGATTGVSLRTALYVAQAGEFGFVLLSLMQTHDLLAPGAHEPGAGGHGAVHAGHALPDPVQQPHRHEAGGQRLAAAVAAGDQHCAPGHQHQRPCADLRLWPLRPEPGAHAGARGHPLHGAGPGPRPRAPGRRRRRFGGVWRCHAAAGADGRRPGARQRPWPSPIWTHHRH